MELPKQIIGDCCSARGWRRTRRLLSLLTGCWTNLIIGLAFSVPVYSSAVKAEFGMWQLQIGMVTSAFLMGSGLSFIPGFCLDCLGPKITNMIGLCLFAVGGSFTSLIVYLRTYHVGSGSHLAFFFFIAGLGSSYFYVANTTVNALNYSSKHRGQVLALLDIFYSASALFYGPVHFTWFASGHRSRGENLWGFTLFVSTFGILAGVANVFGCSRVPLSKEQASKRGHGIKELLDVPQTGSLNAEGAMSWQDFWSLFKSMQFQLLMWTYALSGSVSNLLLSNSTVIAAALEIKKRNLHLVLLPALFSVFAHAFVAPLSDWLKVRYKRSSIWLLCNIALLAAVLLPAAAADASTYPLLQVSFCLGHLGQTGQIFFALMLAERYPRCHFGKLQGTAMFVQSALSLLLQSIFGSLFDLQTSNSAGVVLGFDATWPTTCTGAACFRYSLAFAAFLTFLAAAAGCCLLVLDVRKDEEEDEEGQE